MDFLLAHSSVIIVIAATFAFLMSWGIGAMISQMQWVPRSEPKLLP